MMKMCGVSMISSFLQAVEDIAKQLVAMKNILFGTGGNIIHFIFKQFSLY